MEHNITSLKGGGVWKSKQKPLLIIFIFVLALGVYEFLLRKEIRSNGVYTKCRIVNVEGYKGGLMATITYRFKKLNFTARLTTGKLSKKDINKEYFIMLLPKEPDAVVVHSQVPECLLNVDAPPEGWKNLPECK